MSAGPAAVALAGAPAGRLVDRAGPLAVTRLGLGGVAAGALGLAAAPVGLGLAGYLVPLVTLTLGYALFQTANNTAVMGSAPAAGRGAMSGLLNLSRNLGLVTGASAMGAVYAFASAGAPIDGAGAGAAGAAAGLRGTFLVGAGLTFAALAFSLRQRSTGALARASSGSK
jgi:MFS family permease